MLARTLFALICAAACGAAASADTRIELIGRVDFNGLQLGNCFSPPCPWQHVRQGEYVYVTFLVNDAAPHDLSANWPDCPNQFPRTISDFVYDIRDGTMYARAAGVSLGIPVTQGTVYTQPAFRVVGDNCAVDVIEIEAAIMGRGGRCCYPNGSCTYVKESDCLGGLWTIEGACSPTVNSCVQPAGACCLGDGTCITSVQSSCSGVWAFGACQPAPCFNVPVGSCCATSGSCAITVEAHCTDLWTNGALCDANICTRPGLLPDYAMDLTLRGPKTMLNGSDVLQIAGYYPTSVLDPNHSWTVIFQTTEMFIYDATAFNITSDTTPIGSCCPGDGHCLVTTQAICPVSTSWVSGGSCGPTTCPSGSGACCKPDGSCELLTSVACAAIANAVYQLNGSSCNPSVCPPTGACCNAGSCSAIIQSACIATAGSWLGAGTTCAVLPEHSFALSTIAGACCTASNAACAIKYQSACTSVGQTWTAGGVCNVPCDTAGSCCNNSSGACTVVSAASCANINGTWTGNPTCEVVPCTNLNGDPVGPCCNAVSASCTVVVAAACTGGSTWSSTGTCASVCSAGAGACCNTLDGSCSVRSQPFCTGSTSWTAGATCDVPCSGPGVIVQDATFTSGQPDTPGMYSNARAVSDPAIVQSVEVWLDITMTRLNDLKVQLTGPNGSTVELFTRIDAKPPLCTATPIGPGRVMSGVYTFQDSAPQTFYAYASGLPTGTGPVPGRYKPAGCGGASSSLNAAFAGLSATGNWTLTIIDARSGVSAQLRSWGLSFNGGSPGPCTLGKCVNGPSCSNTTFAQCTSGSWSIGSCTPIACPSGTPGACCIFDTCTVICASQCPTAAGAMFAGSGSACTPLICQTACCLISGGCTLSLPINCGGTAGELFSTCSPNSCAQPVACCYPSGGCVLSMAAACTGGTPGSAGSTCTPNTCPRPAAPYNDVCSTVAASGPDITLDGAGLWLSSGETLSGATESAGLATCSSGLPAADIWFRFNPPASGTYRLQTCNTTPVWDTVISVWSDCSTQIPGSCADDSCGTSPAVYGHATLNTALTSGSPLLVRVGAFGPATSNVGAVTLRVEALGACCNSAGACSLNTQAACSAISTATFRGLYTTCTTNPCPQPRACCNTSTNSCQLVAPSGCTGGRIIGAEGSTCSPVNPCPVGTCCSGATCSVTALQFQCTGLNQVFVVGNAACNASGSSTTPCCFADYNKTAGITVQDIFDYLNDWFAGSSFADTGSDGNTAPDVQSIFDFLNAWFSGGC